MARQSGSGGGMMFIIVLLICLCLSSSAGVGGYFYTTGKKEEEIIEATGENFELKYQEAVRALEAEKQANLQVEVAKTDLEKAQEQLAIAKLEFEGFEFEDDESRQRARTKVFEAEKAAEEAISRLDEAETYAEKAAVERDTAEQNADSALDVAVTNATAAVTKAEGEASARLIAANARLEEAKLDAQTTIEAAEAYAADVLKRGEADRKKIIDDANARLAAATSDAETAAIQREIDKADRDWAKEKEGILADLDTQIETVKEDLSEAQAAVSTANTELAAAQSAKQEAEAGTEAALLATAAARDEAAAIREAAAPPKVPTLMSDGISWQGGGGADRSGLVWLDVKTTPWNKKYKFRCEKNGTYSGFTPEYGPVSHYNYNNPKIRVAKSGEKPCPENAKLVVYDSATNTNITTQVKKFDGVTTYDGYDSVFTDTRFFTGTNPTSSGAYIPKPAPKTDGWIDCELYDRSCSKSGCERDYEGDCGGTFKGTCSAYGLKGPNANGDCYK